MPPRGRRPGSSPGTPRSGWKSRSRSERFRSLLGLRRFFGVAEKDTLEAMLAESATNQQDVTDQLGYQVRKAVEVLIRSLDRADQDHGRALLLQGLAGAAVRGGADGDDAAGVPLLGRGEGAAAAGRPALRPELCRLDLACPVARGGRPAWRGGPGTAARRLVPAAEHVPGRLQRHRPRAAEPPSLRRTPLRPGSVPVPGRTTREDLVA